MKNHDDDNFEVLTEREERSGADSNGCEKLYSRVKTQFDIQ